MPPKRKGSGKKKKSAKGKKDKGDAAEESAAPPPEAGMSAEELVARITRLKDELDAEKEQRNFFQLERDKINTFWEITKKQLEESRAELRGKDRDMEELEERHAVEIKVYKQKVKHLLYEHQNQSVELKSDNAMSLKLAQDEHRDEAGHLRKDKRNLKVELKELELSHEDVIKSLHLEHSKQMSELREDCQRQIEEIRDKYEEKMRLLREDLELKRKAEIHEIEERKNGQILRLQQRHDKAFGDMKNYYNDITLNNLALINNLKEQIDDMKKKEERTDKAMAEVMAENKKLSEPLKQAQSAVLELNKKLAHYDQDKASLRSLKTQLKVQEDTIKQLEWEQEVLKQRFADVERERDDLYDQFVKAIYDVQQKSGFKNLLLEKKLNAISEQLEKKEAQLNEVLSASNLDPTALAVVTKKLEDVLDSKNSAIKELQYELARMTKAYNDTVQAFEGKMKQHNIPVEDLGFKPQPPSELTKQQIGKGPAGLVAQ